MKYKTLFDGTKVSAIWQGGSGITVDPSIQSKLWLEGIRLGCSTIDTAELYNDGLSEFIVGSVLQKVKRSDVFVATKVAPENLSRQRLINACESSLKRLGTDYIDLYQVHWNNPSIPLVETMETMLQLRREGKIRYIGVSNFTLSQIEVCNLILVGELATVQMEYNLFNRVYEKDIIPYCKKMGILFLAYSPFNTGRLNNDNDILKQMAIKYGKTIGQITLNWLTTKYNLCVIPKTNSLQHLIENAQATDFILEDVDYLLIDKAFDKPTLHLKPSDISCKNAKSGVESNFPAYQTVEEATNNIFNLSPSPLELSKEVMATRQLSKPIFVRLKDGRFDLTGGNVRYWAWVIAFGMDEPIECIVEGK